LEIAASRTLDEPGEAGRGGVHAERLGEILAAQTNRREGRYGELPIKSSLGPGQEVVGDFDPVVIGI